MNLPKGKGSKVQRFKVYNHIFSLLAILNREPGTVNGEPINLGPSEEA
jgi:hypothetical protein